MQLYQAEVLSQLFSTIQLVMAYAAPFAVFVLLCAVQLGVCHKTSTTAPPVTKGKDRHGCEVRHTSAFHRELFCSLCVLPVI